MKKITLVLLLSLISVITNAQMQKVELSKKVVIGAYIPSGIRIVELSYLVDKEYNDTTYTLTYRNGKYSTLDDYRDIDFKGNSQIIEDLYKLFMDAFKADDIKSYEQTIQLGKELLVIQGYKWAGMKGVRLITPYGWMNAIGPEHVNKLFGKI